MDDKTVIRFPNDNTVIRPKPGGKRQSASSSYSDDKTQINFRKKRPAASHGNFSPSHKDNMADYRSLPDPERHVYDPSSPDGLNELVHCASTLLSLMIKLSHSVIHDDVSQLKYKLQDEIKQFEINAGRAGVAHDKILQSRYVICTSLDEIVASTPWGQESDWSQQSLLSIFHGETWGGEKFYLLLERLLKEPAKNLDLLELMYICISLGFQGKYRVIDNGHEQVELLKDELYRQLRSLRHDFNKELSSHWRGISDRRGALIRYVPLWVVAALSGVILLAMFSSFTYMLDRSSTPVINEIIKLGPDSFLQKHAEGSLLKDADGSLQKNTDGSLLKQADGSKNPGHERLVRPPEKTEHPSETSSLSNDYNDQSSSFISRQKIILRRIV